MRSMLQKCSTCRFFATHANGNTMCVRYPPKLFIHLIPGPEAGQFALNQTQAWPSVEAGDSCGEHVTAIALAN